MKLITLIKHSRRHLVAMTIAEMMVSVGIFTLVIAGLVSVNLFGMRQDQMVNSQLGANDQARLNFDMMLEEIRSGKNVQVGTNGPGNFTPITNGLQIGDTLQIYPSTNLNLVIYYYFQSNAPTGYNQKNGNFLIRVGVSNAVYTTNVVAQYITNVDNSALTNYLQTTNQAMTFTAENFNGTTWNLLTNDPTTYSTHNYVVNVFLQFYQYQYPMTYVGNGYLYDYYQIELSAARRAP